MLHNFRLVPGPILLGWRLPDLLAGQPHHMVEQSGVLGDVFIDVLYGGRKTATWIRC